MAGYFGAVVAGGGPDCETFPGNEGWGALGLPLQHLAAREKLFLQSYVGDVLNGSVGVDCQGGGAGG